MEHPQVFRPVEVKPAFHKHSRRKTTGGSVVDILRTHLALLLQKALPVLVCLSRISSV